VREIAEIEQPLTNDEVDDVVGDMWLLLLEDDLRRLRSFRGEDLGAWLAMVASQVALSCIDERVRAPQTESFDETVQVSVGLEEAGDRSRFRLA